MKDGANIFGPMSEFQIGGDGTTFSPNLQMTCSDHQNDRIITPFLEFEVHQEVMFHLLVVPMYALPSDLDVALT